jgi:hypothetical protein
MSPGAFEDIIGGNHLAAHRKPHLGRSSQHGAAGTWIAAAAGSPATKHLGNEAPSATGQRRHRCNSLTTQLR